MTWTNNHTVATTTASWPIRYIALFKLGKACVLLAVMAASFHLIRHEPAQVITHWARMIHADPGNRYVHALLAWLLRIDIKHLQLFAVGTGLYALLFITEGIGLWLAKLWAEYLTIVSTAGLLPIEGYELARHISFTKCLVLLGNVVIVVYLVNQVRQKHAKRQEPAP